MTSFRLLSLGCRASQADGAALKKQLLEAGLEEAGSFEQSQVAVLNTCTVTMAADAEARRIIRRIHRRNPLCRVLVTGCYAQRAPQELAQLPGVSWVVGNSHKHAVAELLSCELGSTHCPTVPSQNADNKGDGGRPNQDSGPVQVEAAQSGQTKRKAQLLSSHATCLTKPTPTKVLVGEVSAEFHFAPVFPDDRTRPTLKVQDGCNARCSFCVIPYVRGRSRSLAPEKVIHEIRNLVDAGYHEVVLSGINLGSYGKDLDRRISLLGLIERILAETSIARLRLSSVELMDVSRELIALAAKESRMAQHFHVPLQSGCDRILRLMNRRYWGAQYAARIRAIREQIPNCGIGADVLVGFPGETERDHAASLRFIESLPFTYLHIFPYSLRSGTPAAMRSDQVNGRVIRERCEEIRAVMAEKHRVFLAQQLGRTLSALTLEDTVAGDRLALTTNYLKAVLPDTRLPANTLLNVRVSRVFKDRLYGSPAG